MFNPEGQFAGTNTVTVLQDSCVLSENWFGASGGTGMSSYYFNKKSGKWHQLWLDKIGGTPDLSGMFTDGNMVLCSEELRNCFTRTFHGQQMVIR